MLDFKDKKIDILVSTSVVEVSEECGKRFTHHYWRSRRFDSLNFINFVVEYSVGHTSHTVLFRWIKIRQTLERLKALKTAKNGFELTEFDLTQRGAGELYGAGVSPSAMEAINTQNGRSGSLRSQGLLKKIPLFQDNPLSSPT